MIISFDDCGSEDGTFQIETDENGVHVVFAGDRVMSVEANVDQWGTFYSVRSTSFSVASEAGTRSFLGALIQGLQELKAQTDMCD